MYNKPYNTRHSGRYNTPGQFVSGGELQSQNQYGQGHTLQQQQPQPQLQQQEQQPIEQSQPIEQTQPIEQPQPIQQQQPTQTLLSNNMETKQEQPQDGVIKSEPNASDDSDGRPPWMKTKLSGVKKVSNKERRRRQNEHLRRLLTPKNALMVLNEMMPNDQFTNFKVEPAGVSQVYKSQNVHNFCADLTIEGANYKGYGENKMMARNAAAEQAIRDLILKKMNKALATEEGAAGEAEAEETLPMIQLASFALHKLFTEWEYEGHKVPQLKPVLASLAEVGAEEPPRKVKPLPSNAAAMHPCMLLAYMRPSLDYRELAAEGQSPQTMTFTLGVVVDGITYVGKAGNKREARKLAARSACETLFGVQFDAICTASGPKA